MKKALIIMALIVGTSVYSQAVIVTDTVHKYQFVKPDNMLPLKVDFSYYSKNYDKVFGEFIFTRDATKSGTRNVYVGYGDVLYYQSSSTYIMSMPNSMHSLNFSAGQDIIGGLKNLASLFTIEKDYSVKLK